MFAYFNLQEKAGVYLKPKPTLDTDLCLFQ